MKKFKPDTENWDSMTDMEVLYDYTKYVADYAYDKGFKRGVIDVTIGAAVGLVSLAVIEINKDRINRKIKDIKTKIKMKL